MQGQNHELDDEIDVRGLIRSLWHYKWWILGVTLGAAAVAFLANQSGLAKTYQAKALVVFGQPPLNVNVASPGSTTANVSAFALPDTKGITDLATVGDMLYSVYQSKDLAESRAHGLTFGKFKGELTAALSGTNQLWLQVSDPNQEQAALIANLWAQAVAERLNTLYGSSNAQIAALAQQTKDAQAAWEAAEKALLDYLPESNVDALTAQLTQEQIAYNRQLGRVQSIALLLSDGSALNARLAAQQPGTELTTGDVLSLLVLKQRANDVLYCDFQAPPATSSSADSGLAQSFNCAPSNTVLGVQLQISGTDLSAGQRTIADAQQDLKAFMDSQQAQLTELKGGLAQKEKDLSNLRTQMESAHFHVNQLVQQRDLEGNAYEALSNKLSDVRGEVAAYGQVARVAGQAMPSTSPLAGNQVMQNTILGGALGLILSVFAVFGLAWWEQVDHRA